MVKKLIKNFLIIIVKFVFNLFNLRICSINAERIGHLVENIYLYEILKRNEKKFYIDLIFFSYTENICNEFLFKNLTKKIFSNKKTINIPRKIGSIIYKLIQFGYQNDKNFGKFLIFDINNKKSKWELVTNQVLEINLTNEEINNFSKFLNDHKIPREKYICINLWSFKHLRENLDWSHHNYRLSNDENFLKLINSILEMDFYVVVLGHDEKRFANIKNEKFINYSKYRTEILDILLIKNCYAYISDATGLDYLANAFNKPMLVNSPFIEFFFTHRPNIVYIIKRFFSKKTNKELSLKEALYDEQLMFKVKSSFYDKKKIKIKDNFAEDLINAFSLLISIVEKKEITEDVRSYSNIFWYNYVKCLNNSNRKEKEYYSKNKIKSIYSKTSLEGDQKFI